MGSLHRGWLVVRLRLRRLVPLRTRWHRRRMLFPVAHREQLHRQESRAPARPGRLMVEARRRRRGRGCPRRRGQLLVEAARIRMILTPPVCLIRIGISVSAVRGVRRGQR